MAVDAVAHEKNVVEQCFLDGVTQCEETKTCQECREQEVKWNGCWSRRNEDPSKNAPASVAVRL